MRSEKYKGIEVSKEAFDWLQAEKKRTRLSIKNIVNDAFVQVASLNKGSTKMRLK